MAIKILFFIFILIFIASFTLFCMTALFFGINAGTILGLACTLGSFAGVTTLGKAVTQNG